MNKTSPPNRSKLRGSSITIALSVASNWVSDPPGKGGIGDTVRATVRSKVPLTDGSNGTSGKRGGPSGEATRDVPPCLWNETLITVPCAYCCAMDEQANTEQNKETLVFNARIMEPNPFAPNPIFAELLDCREVMRFSSVLFALRLMVFVLIPAAFLSVVGYALLDAGFRSSVASTPLALWFFSFMAVLSLLLIRTGVVQLFGKLRAREKVWLGIGKAGLSAGKTLHPWDSFAGFRMAWNVIALKKKSGELLLFRIEQDASRAEEEIGKRIKVL